MKRWTKDELKTLYKEVTEYRKLGMSTLKACKKVTKLFPDRSLRSIEIRYRRIKPSDYDIDKLYMMAYKEPIQKERIKEENKLSKFDIISLICLIFVLIAGINLLFGII